MKVFSRFNHLFLSLVYLLNLIFLEFSLISHHSNSFFNHESNFIGLRNLPPLYDNVFQVFSWVAICLSIILLLIYLITSTELLKVISIIGLLIADILIHLLVFTQSRDLGGVKINYLKVFLFIFWGLYLFYTVFFITKKENKPLYKQT